MSFIRVAGEPATLFFEFFDKKFVYSKNISYFCDMKDKDLKQLVTENLNYVKSLANRYRNKGVDYEDLVSEGYMAMVQASAKFDPSRNTQFVAYAGPFIRKAMEKAIEQQASLYRVPKDVRKLAPRSASKAVSIDAPLSIGNQYTLLDILVNKDSLMADNHAEIQQMLQDLQDCLSQLDSREQEILSMFYGIGRAHITMAEIGENMGLKRERVRQIRDKAIRKMSKLAKTKALKMFLRK